jgi:hypothetical protein
MATEQGYYALVAYDRFLNGQTTLFDMSDVELSKGVVSGNQGSGDKEDSSDEEKTSNSNTKAVKVKLKKKDKETSDNEVIVKNWELLVNNKAKHFSNSLLGEQWYSLMLEEPKMPKQQIRYRR